MKPRRLIPQSIYRIVSGLDAKAMPKGMPFLDWSELSPETKPTPVTFDASGAAVPFEPRGRPDGVLFAGAGERLLRHSDALLDAAQDMVFGIEDESAWRWQGSELKTLMLQFFGPHAKLPCMAYAHRVEWSRRTIHRAILPGDVRPPESRPNPDERPRGAPVSLGFELASDEIGLNPGRLLWVNPRGFDPAELRVVRLLEAPDLILGTRVTKPFHRQRVGRGLPLERDPSLQEHGVFPAISERVRPVSRRPSDGRIMVGQADGRLIDAAGIVDSQILRLRRLHPLARSGVMTMDELAISFERFSGRILEVTTEREDSGPDFSETFQDGVLGKWMNAPH